METPKYLSLICNFHETTQWNLIKLSQNSFICFHGAYPVLDFDSNKNGGQRRCMVSNVRAGVSSKSALIRVDACN